MHRRSLLAGLSAAGAIAALPASAQFSLDSLVKGAVGVAGTYLAGEGDEIKLGQTYYPDYLKQSGGAVADRNAQEALRAFAAPLLAAAERKSLPWEITLVDSPQVNAWALPGGKLAINSALVRHAASPDELASVIAHEIGHADRGHGLSQIRNQALLTTIGGLGKEALAAWLGGGGALAGAALSALEGPLYTLVLTGYSRANEFEADAHILSLFERTGYDPAKADDFFRTLMRLHPEGSATTSLFSTHPGTSERIGRIEEAAARLARPSRGAQPPGWAALKQAFPNPAG
ncbi:M48 family metallopeptidase [Magnetospirillum sp. UT-4]|uniref:M48 family metallopeptidase n=1 Tax=Magnetospirillum sp. UT-4 TaxID=2681467 RepID=UPI0013824090|nr:M48 family metallopeptidase [Magnetospirillum sp. UT-4]CAA7626455.1 putative Peptidase M48, Ste24p [Magnetospirillum sp. UT-4]